MTTSYTKLHRDVQSKCMEICSWATEDSSGCSTPVGYWLVRGLYWVIPWRLYYANPVIWYSPWHVLYIQLYTYIILNISLLTRLVMQCLRPMHCENLSDGTSITRRRASTGRGLGELGALCAQKIGWIWRTCCFQFQDLNIIWRFPKIGVPHGTMVFGDPLQSITARPSLEADEMGIIQWFLNFYGGIYWDMIYYWNTNIYIYVYIYTYVYIYYIISCFPKKRNLTWCFHHILFSDTHQHVPKKWPWDQ